MLISPHWAYVLTAFIALTPGCSDKNSLENTHDNNQRIGSGVVPYEGIEPNTLFLGKKIGESAQQCVRAVVIKDNELACLSNRCDIQAFYLPVRPVLNGQRALHVMPCNIDPELANGHLLTDRSTDDSSAILYFQANRSGNELWKQLINDDGHYEIEFPTEAAEGILQLNAQGQYVWNELPD
jgi:hypothetical protein